MTWVFVVAYDADDYETPRGFARSNAERHNSLRVGNLIIAFGTGR